MLALLKNPFRSARRTVHRPPVELTDRRLEKMMKALAILPQPEEKGRLVRRRSVHPKVSILPFLHGRSGPTRSARIHDISAAGVAVMMREPIAVGTQFKLMIPRRFRRSIEVLCTARHCRKHETKFIVGAEYGVSWLETLGTLVAPTKMSEAIARRAWEEAAQAAVAAAA